MATSMSQVNTHTDRQDFRQDFGYGTCVVIRRFRDFAWLSQRLEEEFPGIVMPALPVKMVVGKFDQAFVEVRCLAELLVAAVELEQALK